MGILDKFGDNKILKPYWDVKKRQLFKLSSH